MFSSKPRAKISIQPYQGIFHLHPPNEYEHLDPDAPDADETFWGNVVLSLPKPREFKSLVVKLNAHYSVAVPGHSTETGILSTWECQIPIPPSLDKGEHSFAWSLKVPRSSAPYERCAFGEVYHKLHAVAQSPAGHAPIKAEFMLEMIVSPLGAEGSDTSVLNERIEGFHEDVGPYLMALASQHLTVGGVAHFSLNLASVPAPLHIHTISAHIIQSYTLLSHAKPGRSGVPMPHRRQFFALDHRTQLWTDDSPSASGKRPATVLKTSSSAKARGGASMAVLDTGDSLQVSHVARLPDDNLLRPSTHEGTHAPIRVSHKVVLEVMFSTPSAPHAPRILRAERQLRLLSCGCLPEDLAVPPYDMLEDAVLAKLENLKRVMNVEELCIGYITHYACMCMYTLDELLQTHHAPLLSAHEAAARPEARPEDVFVANKRKAEAAPFS